jgi:hypothetical protein
MALKQAQIEVTDARKAAQEEAQKAAQEKELKAAEPRNQTRWRHLRQPCHASARIEQEAPEANKAAQEKARKAAEACKQAQVERCWRVNLLFRM